MCSHGKRNHFKSFLIAALVLSLLCFGIQAPAVNGLTGLDPYSDVRGADLSGYDFTQSLELLKTLTYDTYTVWPSLNKMPAGFDPAKVMEAGKDPGLGIRELQKQGYTGRGVTVGYVDQYLLTNHTAYDNVDLYYGIIDNPDVSSRTSMHGPAVLSLLAGKETGIVPDAKVYFFGNSGGDKNNLYEALSFERAVEVNKGLPSDKKIRIIGMSHTYEENGKYPEYAEHLKKAEQAARDSGIIVIDTGYDMATCGSMPFGDRNNFTSYRISNWEKPRFGRGNLFVPADFRTTAVGHDDRPDHYAFWSEGGFSWGVPYIVGVIAMGLQIDPDLTEEKAVRYLYNSGNSFHNGKIINPAGFLELVKKNCKNPRDVTLDKDYRYFLYNKDRVDESDLAAIDSYISKFDSSEVPVLLNTSGCKTAVDVYNLLKADKDRRRGELKGIQIFGVSGDVPAFDIQYKIKLPDGFDEGGSIKSDHFYSNLNSKDLAENLSVYDILAKNLKVDFMAQWPVARLPLTKGEFKAYMQKYDSFQDAVKGKQIPVVNFSSPIFPYTNHSDDTGVLLDRMAGEFKIINGGYRLYGNTQGLYPVSTKVLGDFSKESLISENSKEICTFFINSHGQDNNFDKYLVDMDKNLANYSEREQVRPLENGISEFRQSLVNINNINSVLSQNYYNLYTRSCSSAYNLDEKNIIHEAMAKGKLVTAIANTSVNSNNGMRVDADLRGLKNNNPAYSFLMYVYSLLSGNSTSRSFYIAKAAYTQEVLKYTQYPIDYGKNYQFQLHNVLVQSYLGLLDYTADENVPLSTLLQGLENSYNTERVSAPPPVPTPSPVPTPAPLPAPDGITYKGQALKIPLIKTSQKDSIAYADDGYAYCRFPTGSGFETPGFVLNELSAAHDRDNVYIKVKYASPINARVGIRLGGDAPGLSEWYENKTMPGNNVMIVKLDKQKLKSYKESVCIEVGDEQSILVDKEFTDLLASIKVDEKLLTSPCLRTNGRLIPYNSDSGYPYTDAKGNTLVPFETTMEAIAATISTDEKRAILTAAKGNTKIEIEAGKTYVTVNGKKMECGAASVVTGGKVYIPLNAVKNLVKKIADNETYGIIDITT